MIRALIFLAILILGSTISLKCPPKPILAWEAEENSTLNIFQCPELEIVAGTTNIKLLINMTKKIESLINQIIETTNTNHDIESNSANIIPADKDILIAELVKLLGLDSLINDKKQDLNNFMPMRLKLLPIAIIQGYARASHQVTIQAHAFTQYSKLLQRIRRIFSGALNQCYPLGLLNGLLETMFCCCPSWRKGATGKLAEELMKNDVSYNVINAIGLTLQFLVEECDRQLDDIFKNYNPSFPERIYEKKHLRTFLEIVANKYGFSWFIES